MLLPLLALAVSGCETLDRMDYLDRFFEPAASRPVSTAATDALRRPAEPSPPPPMDWNPQPVSVVAMEPIENPEDRWTTGERYPQQAAARAAPPRPEAGAPPAAVADPEARTRSLVRQNPWLTRFWMELTPAQRARVERQLQRGTGEVRLASEGRAEPAAVWDPMGLSDRANLVFGKGASTERSAPPAKDRGASPPDDES